jgi:hypothetical protein
VHVVVTGCECAKEPRHGDVLRSSGGKNPPLLDGLLGYLTTLLQVLMLLW